MAQFGSEKVLDRVEQEGHRGGKGGPFGCAACLLLIGAERLEAATAGRGIKGRTALEVGVYLGGGCAAAAGAATRGGRGGCGREV